jgi:transposase-like protein
MPKTVEISTVFGQSVVRISRLDLKKIKIALAHKSRLLEKNIRNKTDTVRIAEKDFPFGKDVKMVRKITLKQRLLTPTEKDEAVVKYRSGMTMTDVANLYGCHYTTVGRILRQNGVAIRG